MKDVTLDREFAVVANPPEGWQGNLGFTSLLGRNIRYGRAPASGVRKGTVVLTHGYGEAIDIYYEVIRKYQEKGYDVFAMDWQGFGLSERDDPGRPQHPSAKGLLRHVYDLHHFVTEVVDPQRDKKVPLVMSTHSMGGHIGLLYLRKFPGMFDGAVMSAPMFDIYRLGLPRLFRPVLRLAFNAASKMGLRDAPVPRGHEILRKLSYLYGGLRGLTSCQLSLREKWGYMMDTVFPSATVAPPTFGWLAAAFNTILPSTEDSFLKSIDTPVLIGSAGREDLVDNRAHTRAAQMMPRAQHVTIKESRHGLWFGADETFDEWWNHVSSFLDTVKGTHVHAGKHRALHIAPPHGT